MKTKNIAIMLNEVSDGIKKVAGIKKFDNTKPLIDASDKLPADIIVKDILIVITCAIKDNNKQYPQIFLEEGLYNKNFVLSEQAWIFLIS